MSIFSFKGRAKRSEFWAVTLPIAILSSLVDLIPDDAFDNTAFCISFVIFAILITWIELATNTRRCHDLGHNGFWQLIPLYGIWMGFVKGEDVPNKYGPEK